MPRAESGAANPGELMSRIAATVFVLALATPSLAVAADAVGTTGAIAEQGHRPRRTRARQQRDLHRQREPLLLRASRLLPARHHEV